MRFHIITPAELDESLQQDWRKVLKSRFFYNRPYYQPEWAKLIGSIRGDARISVIEDAGHIIGFLPYQLDSLNRNPALGVSLADYQGPIYSDKNPIPTDVWLSASQCKYWQFDNLPYDLKEFVPHAWKIKKSQWMDLQGGYSEYCNRLADKNSGAKPRIIKDAEYDERKIKREYNDYRFVFDNRDSVDFSHFKEGKSFQYVSSLGSEHDMFRVEWIRDTIEQLFYASPGSFLRGRFSSLHIGNQLIAGSFGPECNGILQFNILWYDPKFSRYSPGTQLLNACAKHGPNAGLHTLELGGGEYAYKAKFRTNFMDTMAGAVSKPAIYAKVHAAYLRLRWRLRDTKIGQKLKKFV